MPCAPSKDSRCLLFPVLGLSRVWYRWTVTTKQGRRRGRQSHFPYRDEMIQRAWVKWGLSVIEKESLRSGILSSYPIVETVFCLFSSILVGPTSSFALHPQPSNANFAQSQYIDGGISFSDGVIPPHCMSLSSESECGLIASNQNAPPCRP